jgi:hypothetical protein
VDEDLLEERQGAFIRRLGEALPEVKFAVQGRVKRFAFPRPAEVLNLYSWAGKTERPHHYVVAVLAITEAEARELSRTSSEFNQRQREKLRTAREIEVSHRSNRMSLLKRVAMTAAIVAGSLFLVGPAYATTMVEVDVPPAQQLFLGVDQVPVNPVEISFMVDGFEIVVSVVPGPDAADNLPLDLYVAAGPEGSIHLSNIPEPGTAAMMGLGLLGLVMLGRDRRR